LIPSIDWAMKLFMAMGGAVYLAGTDFLGLSAHLGLLCCSALRSIALIFYSLALALRLVAFKSRLDIAIDFCSYGYSAALTAINIPRPVLVASTAACQFSSTKLRVAFKL